MKFINPHKLYVGSFLPEWLEKRSDVSPGAKLVYARLCRFAGKDGIAYPKIETISDSLAMNDRSVKRYLKELRVLNLIDAEIRGLGKASIYRFIDPELDKNCHGKGDKSCTVEVTEVVPKGDNNCTVTVQDLSPPILRESIEDNHIKRINGKEGAHSREPNHFEKANEVLLYLNEVAGKNFLPNLTNKKYIAERISEGRAVEELKEIVDLKFAQSQRKQKNGQPIFGPQFLRPQTLFSEQNCEKYINEINEIKEGKTNGFEFEGSHSKQQRRLEAIRGAGIDPFAMFGYE